VTYILQVFSEGTVRCLANIICVFSFSRHVVKPADSNCNSSWYFILGEPQGCCVTCRHWQPICRNVLGGWEIQWLQFVTFRIFLQVHSMQTRYWNYALKMLFFWVFTPCRLLIDANVSEKHTAWSPEHGDPSFDGGCLKDYTVSDGKKAERNPKSHKIILCSNVGFCSLVLYQVFTVLQSLFLASDPRGSTPLLPRTTLNQLMCSTYFPYISSNSFCRIRISVPSGAFYKTW
jgi:hypothetical protein